MTALTLWAPPAEASSQWAASLPTTSPRATTTALVPFSVPVRFEQAVEESRKLDSVVGIRYENPELAGEYYFASQESSSEFLADFASRYRSEPAVVGLIVEVHVDTDPSHMSRSAPAAIDVDGPAFVPPPTHFDERIQSLLTPLAQQARSTASPMAVGTDPWMPSRADVQVFRDPWNSNLVDFYSSYWWLDTHSPSYVPSGFRVEFEINLDDLSSGHLTGKKPNCYDSSQNIVYDYKCHLAAVNENWNWAALRPDYQTVPASLSAYADYNDQSDACNHGSFAIGVRYPQNIQFVNGAYGIIFSIQAPRGYDLQSTVSAVNQAVNDSFCTTGVGSLMALTDCMGVYSGSWPSSSGASSQKVLNVNRGWPAPTMCWSTDWLYGGGVPAMYPCT